MSGPRDEAEDRLDRDAIAKASTALSAMNDAIRRCIARGIRVEFGIVADTSDSYGKPIKSAREWRQLWTDDGLAARFTREEIATAIAPQPPVCDADPGVR